MSDAPLRLFIVAGEESGDKLGGSLIKALRERVKGDLEVMGVGGQAMAEEGLQSIFDMDEIAVMGVSAVIMRLPKILQRIHQTAKAVIAAKPDALIIIDSPDFTHRVARKARAALPDLPVIDYICPSVWAWRSSRAQKMSHYIDHVLAILPFEPKVLKRLNGPDATYIGHPLAASSVDKNPKRTLPKRKSLLVLPGSRSGEVKRLLPVFKVAIQKLQQLRDDFDVTIPVVPHMDASIREALKNWPMRVEITSNVDQKKQVFEKASAALAASGTVCLELALSNTPMIATYKLDPLMRMSRFMITSWSVNLPNLIVDYPAVPEYYDEFLNPDTLCRLLNRLLDNTPERKTQLDAFDTLRHVMACEEGGSASEKAADIVLQLASRTSEL